MVVCLVVYYTCMWNREKGKFSTPCPPPCVARRRAGGADACGIHFRGVGGMDGVGLRQVEVFWYVDPGEIVGDFRRDTVT